MNEDKILKKLVEQDGKFDKVFKKLVEQDGKFERVIIRVVDIDEKMKGLATQKSLDEFKEETSQNFDKQGVILQRLDQERLFMLERVKRIEADVEKLKVQLHLVPN